MKREFIRTVFGDCRTGVLNEDIMRLLKSEFNDSYTTYVFGKDNLNYLQTLGLKCIMIEEKPSIFHMHGHIFRHKLEVYRYAMENDGYDQIVFLDWDLVPTKKIPDDFWQQLENKESIQGCLYSCGKKRLCRWRRNEHKSFIINASFLYIGDKSIPSKLIKIWNDFPDETCWRYNDEIAISKFIDDNYGGWVGEEKWFNMFEPRFAHLERKSFFDDRVKEKDICFLHRWH